MRSNLKEINLNFTDEEMGKLARLAHERGFTFEGYLNEVLSTEVIKEQAKKIKRLKTVVMIYLIGNLFLTILRWIRKER